MQIIVRTSRKTLVVDVEAQSKIFAIMLDCSLRSRQHMDGRLVGRGNPFRFTLVLRGGLHDLALDRNIESYDIRQLSELTFNYPMHQCRCDAVGDWQNALYDRGDWRSRIGISFAVMENDIPTISKACGALRSGELRWCGTSTGFRMLYSLQAVLVAFQYCEDVDLSTRAEQASAGMCSLDDADAFRLATTQFPWSTRCSCCPRMLIEYRLPLNVLERLNNLKAFDIAEIRVQTLLLYTDDAKRLDYVISSLHPRKRTSLLQSETSRQMLWQNVACDFDGEHFGSGYVLMKHFCMPDTEVMKAVERSRDRDERLDKFGNAVWLYFFVKDLEVLHALVTRGRAIADKFYDRVFSLDANMTRIIVRFLLPAR